MSLPEHRVESLLLHDHFVRALARSLLSDRHAAEDVAQETWVAALKTGGAATWGPRWLASVVKNLAHKARRGEQRRERRESKAARPEAVPSTRDLLEREAARTELVEAVLALEEPCRDAVVLRYFENLPPRAIAKRLGIPVETVRTRLKRALARLRERLDRRYGGREAWGALLFPLARHAPLSFGPALLTAMSKAKLAVAVVVVALAALLFWNARRSSSFPAAAAPSTRSTESLADAQSPAPRLSPVQDLGARIEVPAVVEPEPGPRVLESTGSLLVRARWHDGTAASGIVVQADSPSLVFGTHTLQMRETVTSSQGEGRFEGLEPGHVLVVLERALEQPTTIRIEAGKEALLELTIPRGFDVDGVVLDPFGRSVSGAEVWRFEWGAVESGFPVARTGADGRFEVRSSTTGNLGARASGFAPSLLATVKAAEGAHVSLELVLMGPGGDVSGTVLDQEGRPVAGAFVLAGVGRNPITHGITATPVGGSEPIQGLIPGPIEGRTDAGGAYRIRGLAPGPCRVAVRAKGFAIWRGEVEVFEHGSAALDVRLSAGVDVYGGVTDASGRPARAEVSAGRTFGLLASDTTTAADGTFVLEDLEPGEIELHAEGDRGRASTKLRGSAGDELIWDAVLVTGGPIRGRVVDESGAGLAGWSVRVEDDPMVGADASGAVTDFDHKSAQTDAEGRFVVEDCHDRSHRVEAHAPGCWMFASATAKGVFPGHEELVLRVESDRLPSVRITGVVVDENGRGVGDAQLTPTESEAGGGVVLSPEADGSFEFGPYPPGSLSLYVRSSGFPDVVLGPKELSPGEAWECGEVVLRPGGTLLVTAKRDGETRRAAPELVVMQGPSWRGRLSEEEDRWRSDPLTPGAYRLAVRGRDVAARLIPFEIRAGEATEIELSLAPGRAARIRVESDGEDRRPLLRIQDSRGATLVEEELWRREGGRFALDLALERGSYRVEASRAGRRVEANLVVEPDEGAPELVLELQ